MAKGIGLIGNFKGKVGNMVGYKLTDSNSGNTQGIRVYQPIVKNPKTAAQAEQRAKLAPINATYRALKMIIDRGNEGLPYGNKSRLAWLKQAFKAELMPWIEKGSPVNAPVGCQLTKGSLASLNYEVAAEQLGVVCTGLADSANVGTIGGVSTALKTGNPILKDGDQVTFVGLIRTTNAISATVLSIVIDTTDATAIDGFTAGEDKLNYEFPDEISGYAVIVSREGANGEHLRSTEYLEIPTSMSGGVPYDSDSKAAAIKSYMSSAAVNSDWAEESIQ